jgi:hypothetical protein
MWSTIKRWFGYETQAPQATESNDDDDQIVAECVRRCFETGRMVIGSRDDDGRVTIVEKVSDEPSSVDRLFDRVARPGSEVT